MSFFSPFKHILGGVGKVINAVPGGNILADIALAATGNPEFIPAVNAASTVGKTGNLGAGIGSAIGSYAGNALGSSIFGNLGTVGDAFGKVAGNALSDNAGTFLGNDAGNILGSSFGGALGNLASVPLSNAIGSFAGNAIGANLGASLSPAKASSGGGVGTSAFNPTQSALQPLPASLQGFDSLSPEQQTSNLATKGTYGGGLGPQEQSYFLNLINRQLVDKSNNVSPMSNLQPIENSYLSQLGLGGYGNSNNLLQAISQRNT